MAFYFTFTAANVTFLEAFQSFLFITTNLYSDFSFNSLCETLFSIFLLFLFLLCCSTDIKLHHVATAAPLGGNVERQVR